MSKDPNSDHLTGYELSRNWFDWCFENPDLISPNHTALYFFSIEHWNRLGQKEKFGLPTQMCMDAIGISNWRTFSKTCNNLVDWGFFKLISKSKNQYSATVIAIVKNTKANTKALTKATQKHLQKQRRSIAVIDKPINLLTIEPNTQQQWRENFDIYLSQMTEVYLNLKNDINFIKSQQEYYPGMDIPLSLQKSVDNYWGLKAGWKNKKKSKSENPDWEKTFKNSLSQPMNKVYKPKQSNVIMFDTKKEDMTPEQQEHFKRFAGYKNEAN